MVYELCFRSGELSSARSPVAILGVIPYYAGTFIGALLLVVIGELSGAFYFDEDNEFVLSLLAIPFGILACWGLYKILERNWGKEERFNEDIIDEIGQ